MPRRVLVSSLVIVAAALSVVASRVSRGSGSAHDFAVSHESEVRVLRVESQGGLASHSTRYELFGDGRIETLSVSGYASGTPQLLYRDQLELDEYDLLVVDLVDSGLMEFDPRKLRDEFASAPTPTDQPAVRVVFRLESYDDRDVGEAGFVENSFVLDAPRVRAQQFPEIKELAALNKVLRMFSDLHRKHLASQR